MASERFVAISFDDSLQLLQRMRVVSIKLPTAEIPRWPAFIACGMLHDVIEFAGQQNDLKNFVDSLSYRLPV